MKKMIVLALCAGLATGYGCSSRKDSDEAADKINEAKVDSQATAIGSDAKSEADDVNEYMVDLANSGRTELELSKLAAERATSAAVKAYAQETAKQHRRDETELKAEAENRKITLPTTLSNDSRDRVADLDKEKAGEAFDKKYLDQMAEVNDKAVSRAKKLIESSKDAALKTYVQQVMADDEQHKAKAKQLKDEL